MRTNRMNSSHKVLFLLFASLHLIVNGKHHVCDRSKLFSKIGCYSSNRADLKLAISDRLHNSEHAIDWTNMEAYTHSLACRCSAKAKEMGKDFFSLDYYGECWVPNDDFSFEDHVNKAKKGDIELSNNCMTSDSFSEECREDSDLECVGKSGAGYIYKMKHAGKTEIALACEHVSTATLKCPDSARIHITKALYGRINGKTCGKPYDDMQCAAKSSLDVVKRRCESRNSCVVHPSNSWFGDPCHGINKYLEVEYTCVMPNAPQSVDGGFSAWTEWSVCSKTCGEGGVQVRERGCNNPVPEGNGENCYGPTEETRQCDLNPCTKYELGEVYSFASKNYPRFSIGVRGGKIAAIINKNGQASKFKLVAALNGKEGAISLQSIDKDNTYLRHEKYVVKEHQNDGSQLFKDDASFHVREDKYFPGYSAFESSNYPGHFIRHYSYILHMHKPTTKSNGIPIFEKDASYRFVKSAGVQSDYEQSVDGYSYKFYTERKNWHDAAEMCKKEGARLAVVENEHTAQFLNLYKRTLWIGGSDKKTEGAWVWQSGAAIKNMRWIGQKPNGGRNENCLMAYTNGMWNDHRCTATHEFVCQTEQQTGYSMTSGSEPYKYFSTKVTWHEAKQKCKNEGMRLAYDNNPETRNYLKAQKASLWIGGSDEATEGNWLWTDNTPITTFHWHAVEPNGKTNENCIHFRPSGEWNDLICAYKLAFVCEHDMDAGGYTRLQDASYKLFSERLSWSQAKARCEEDGAQMAMGKDDLDYLKSLGRHLWLGATDLEQEGTWRYIDDTPVTTTHWRQNEPNGGDFENCLTLRTDGQWNDMSCDNGVSEFVCKKVTKEEDGYKRTSHGSYKLHPKQAWKQAQQKCHSEGAHLVTGKSTEEQKYLKSLRRSHLWLGISDSHQEGIWQYEDGSLVTKTHWNPVEPNGYTKENCVEMRLNGEWNDMRCDYQLEFVCKKAELLFDEAESGVQYLYKVHPEKRAWHDAQKVCQSEGGRLAVGRDVMYARLFKGLKENVWVGASDADDKSTWKWVTGEKVRGTNWKVGEPNDLKQEDCLLIYPGGKWNDLSCEKEMAFVCQTVVPEDYEMGTDGKFYKYYSRSATWSHAKLQCEKDGAQLAIDDGEATHAYLATRRGSPRMWIGGNDIKQENKWVWMNGQPITTPYFTMSRKEPNGGRMENCLQLNHHGAGSWNDSKCTNKYPYLCQKDVLQK